MDGPRLQVLAASDGYALHTRVWPGAAARATVVASTGIMSHGGWFASLAPGLGRAGLTLVAPDRRGSGRNRDARGDAPSAARLVADSTELIDALADPKLPLFLLGWCWGAALAIHAAHRLGPRVAGVILVTPGLFPSEAVRDKARAHADVLAHANPSEPVVPIPIAESMFTQGPALTGFILTDTDRLQMMTPRLATIGRKLALSAMARLRAMSTPVLLILAERDRATDNAATTAAFARLGSRVTTAIVPGEHGVQFDAPAEVAAAIAGFVERVRAKETR